MLLQKFQLSDEFVLMVLNLIINRWPIAATEISPLYSFVACFSTVS
jgi:hypothetical protein